MRFSQEKILEALRFAATQHKGIYRNDGFTPYLLHVLEVVYILIGKKIFDYNCIIAAIIHDVVEDTGAKIKEIRKRFGSVIARIVDLLSKHKNSFIRKAYWWRMRNEWNENIRWRVIVIKFADRIHNLMTLDKMPNESQKKKVHWVRHKLARPVCTEGEHFCGVPVWLDFPGAVRRL